MKKLNKKGFTLIELLAVIVILALLMVVVGSSVGTVQDNARKKAIESESTKIINKAYEDYQNYQMMGSGKYTYSSSANADGTTTPVTFTDSKYTLIATAFTNGKITTYCVQDDKGAKLSTGDYTSGKKCKTDGSAIEDK